MLYKKDTDKDWKYNEWRYFCECTSPDHILGFDRSEDRGVNEFNIWISSNPHMTIWRRITNAFKILFKKEVCFLSVVILEEDRQELASAINGTYEFPEEP